MSAEAWLRRYVELRRHDTQEGKADGPASAGPATESPEHVGTLRRFFEKHHKKQGPQERQVPVGGHKQYRWALRRHVSEVGEVEHALSVREEQGVESSLCHHLPDIRDPPPVLPQAYPKLHQETRLNKASIPS